MGKSWRCLEKNTVKLSAEAGWNIWKHGENRCTDDLQHPFICFLRAEARRELSEVMKVSGGTISAKVEGSTDLARGMLHIFKDTLQRWENSEKRGNPCSLPRERIQ